MMMLIAEDAMLDYAYACRRAEMLLARMLVFATMPPMLTMPFCRHGVACATRYFH